ncbi:hypothetical protein Tco_0805564 [Tanacetum coccineum]
MAAVPRWCGGCGGCIERGGVGWGRGGGDGDEGGDDSGGEMMVWRGVGCGDGGGAVKAVMVMAAAKAVVVRTPYHSTWYTSVDPVRATNLDGDD